MKKSRSEDNGRRKGEREMRTTCEKSKEKENNFFNWEKLQRVCMLERIIQQKEKHQVNEKG